MKLAPKEMRFTKIKKYDQVIQFDSSNVNYCYIIGMKGYRMADFASICQQASTSSDQFSHASSEHLVNFLSAEISLY